METKMRNSKVKKVRAASFKTKDVEDIKVLEQIKAGKIDAYEFIYNKYHQYIQYHCFLSVKNKQIADDLTAEILTKVYLNLDKYQIQYTFNSWVWGIARNHVIDYIRKSKNDPININKNSVIQRFVSNDSESSESLNVHSSDVESEEPNPEEVINNKEVVNARKQFVKNLLDGMSERERQILVHYYFDEMSYEEIATKMGLKLNSMKVYMLRAKEQLKNKIGSIANVSHLLA